MFRYALGVIVTMVVSCAMSATSPVTGLWGGDQVRLTLDASGGRIEYACGSGTIDIAVNLDPQGSFNANGKHEEHRAGPTVADSAPVTLNAHYRGKIDGDTMSLAVRIAGDKAVRSFTLVRGRNVKLIRCF